MQGAIERQIRAILDRYGFDYSILTMNQVGRNTDTFSGHVAIGRQQVYIAGKYRADSKCGFETYIVVSLSINNENLPIGRR